MLIKKIKDRLPEGYGIVVLKKGLKEKVIGEEKKIDTSGGDLVCLCAGEAQKERLEDGYRILIIVNNNGQFEAFEYTRKHRDREEEFPIGRKYKSNFFL